MVRSRGEGWLTTRAQEWIAYRHEHRKQEMEDEEVVEVCKMRTGGRGKVRINSGTGAGRNGLMQHEGKKG